MSPQSVQDHLTIGGHHVSGGEEISKIHAGRSSHCPVVFVKALNYGPLAILLAKRLRADIHPHNLHIVINVNELFGSLIQRFVNVTRQQLHL